MMPVQPPIMLAGGASVFVGFIFTPLAKLIALIPYASLWWTVFVVEKTASVPWGSIEVNTFGRLISALYIAIFGLGFLCWLLRQEQHADTLIPDAWRPQLRTSFAATVPFILLLWGGATWMESQPDGRLHIQLLGRERAVATLITTPGGNRILLDPIREPPNYPLDAILTSLPGGQRPLDLVIQARPAPEDALPVQVEYRTLLAARDPSFQPDATISLDAGLTLTILHTPAESGDSLLFLLRYGDFTTLLPFETSQQTQAALLDRIPDSLTLLLAPYPGAGAWLHPDVITNVHAQVVLESEGTTYPPAVQQALAESVTISRIPNDAVIEIISDGSTFNLLARPYSQDVIQR